MTSLISVQYPRDDVLRSRIHTEFHETLFLEFLLPAIAEQQSKSDPDWPPISTTYATWAEDELLLLGYVSCFHLWERQLLLLMSAQLQRLGLPLPPRGKRSFTSYSRDVLSKSLAADLPDSSIWQSLDNARRIVNAYKHGPGRGFDEARKLHPDFFHPGNLDGDPDLIQVTKAHFQELVTTLKNFWDSLPYEIKYA